VKKLILVCGANGIGKLTACKNLIEIFTSSAYILEKTEMGWLLKEDLEQLEKYTPKMLKTVYAMHRNDFLVRSNEYRIKEKFKYPGYEILQYLLIDGEFRGAVVGHFRNGPYDLEDVVLDLTPEESGDRKMDILAAICAVNYGKSVTHYQGEK